MWENEYKKALIRNGIIFLLLVLVAAGLFITMKAVNQKIAEEDALLMQEHSSQRQELYEARQENWASIQKIYEGHLETVAQYLPGIICWGDSLTAGSSGNVSYPLTLQEYINTYLCDIYDLQYSVENPENYSRLTWDDYKISIPVVNMGAGKENTATILGRSSVRPYVVKTEFVIPATKEGVAISLVSEDGKAVMPLMAGNAGMNPVSIAGVEGTLTRIVNTQTWGGVSYQFTRLEEGQETVVPEGTEIITACKDAYRDYIHIVWLGTYDDFTTAEALVEDTKLLLQRQLTNQDRYLVIGPCTYRGSWSNVTSASLDSIDSAMLQAFGNHYINLRKYLVEDGLRDAQITATKEDTVNINNGQVPSSFRSNASGADLNGLAYQLVGKLVYERMELLGFFEEIREALNLDKITQDILKDDPKYFETLLK